MGHDFHYGRTDLISIVEPIRPTDIPIKPGQSLVFTMPDRYVRGWNDVIREHKIPQPKRVQIVFQFINFGDGTGYWGSSAAPLPHPNQSASNAKPCDWKGGENLRCRVNENFHHDDKLGS
jgi:hypothetical protein